MYYSQIVYVYMIVCVAHKICYRIIYASRELNIMKQKNTNMFVEQFRLYISLNVYFGSRVYVTWENLAIILVLLFYSGQLHHVILLIASW